MSDLVGEYDVLQRFWAAANGSTVSRLALLREYASIVIGPCANAASVREESKQAQRLQRARVCFGCQWSLRQALGLIWHHIIQVQHGGSSSLWNQVPLCRDCHALVHPWLPRPACKGFVSTLDARGSAKQSGAA